MRLKLRFVVAYGSCGTIAIITKSGNSLKRAAYPIFFARLSFVKTWHPRKISRRSISTFYERSRFVVSSFKLPGDGLNAADTNCTVSNMREMNREERIAREYLVILAATI